MNEQRMYTHRLSTASGIRLAPEVRMQGLRPELLLALMIVSDLCSALDAIVVVTAILNGRHMHNSLHYTGAAVDGVLAVGVDQALWVDELQKRLGINYDVIGEDDHIHIEYQPHVGA